MNSTGTVIGMMTSIDMVEGLVPVVLDVNVDKVDRTVLVLVNRDNSIARILVELEICRRNVAPVLRSANAHSIKDLVVALVKVLDVIIVEDTAVGDETVSLIKLLDLALRSADRE